MELNVWTGRFKEIYEGASEMYRTGSRELSAYFTPEQEAFLLSIGIKPINLYDFVEDFISDGEPDWETTLLMVAARRDFLLCEQKGQRNAQAKEPEFLPSRDAELGGIRWLPRIIKKARLFLRGELRHDIMYCCGGDRGFLKRHGIHPADFLRAVWAADGDDDKILHYVRAAERESARH